MIEQAFTAAPVHAMKDVTRRICVEGPASLSNLGPGFDALGLCITGYSDSIEIIERDDPGILVECFGDFPCLIPLDPRTNTASVAARIVMETAGVHFGALIRIKKGIPFGSGIGGSAASAVAGAWAANILIGEQFSKEELVDAVLEGEAVASGSRHGDNVLPALFGGLVLVSSSEPSRYRRIELPGDLHLAIVMPEVEILTHAARTMLPGSVSLRDAAHNAAELAFLVSAAQVGDWEELGRSIMQDRLVEVHRAQLVPCYKAVKAAALAAGAFGCALTGSGPAMFAIASDAEAAEFVLTAMIAACREGGKNASGKVVQVNNTGVRIST